MADEVFVARVMLYTGVTSSLIAVFYSFVTHRSHIRSWSEANEYLDSGVSYIRHIAGLTLDQFSRRLTALEVRVQKIEAELKTAREYYCSSSSPVEEEGIIFEIETKDENQWKLLK